MTYGVLDEVRIACQGSREQRAELALQYLVEERAAELDRAMEGFDLARVGVSFVMVAVAIGGTATLLAGSMRASFLAIFVLPAGASLYWAWSWSRVRALLRELRMSLWCADQAGLSVIVEMRDCGSAALRWRFAPRSVERESLPEVPRGAASEVVSGHLIERDVKLRSVMDWILLVQRAEAAARRAQRQRD